MNSVDSVTAVEGRGLIGDRYYTLSGTFSKTEIEPDQEITLIESEAFEELKQEHDIDLDFSQSRRNVVTHKVDLNDLVGKTFKVGEVSVTGMRLCEPCAYLSEVTGNPKLVKQWLHRAGLRARINKGGEIRIDDEIVI